MYNHNSFSLFRNYVPSVLKLFCQFGGIFFKAQYIFSIIALGTHHGYRPPQSKVHCHCLQNLRFHWLENVDSIGGGS